MYQQTEVLSEKRSQGFPYRDSATWDISEPCVLNSSTLFSKGDQETKRETYIFYHVLRSLSYSNFHQNKSDGYKKKSDGLPYTGQIIFSDIGFETCLEVKSYFLIISIK